VDSGLVFLFTSIVFLLVFIVPGYLLMKLFFDQINITFASFLPISFTSSLIFYFPLVLISYFFHLPIAILPIAAGLITVITLATIIVKKRVNKLKIPKPTKEFTFIALVIIVLFSIVISYQIKANADGDSLYHLGFINKIAENSTISPTDAFFKTNTIPSTYGYNAWYPQVALLFKLSVYPPEAIWSILNSILVVIVVLSAATITEFLFGSEKFAWIGAFAFVGIQSFFSGFFDFQILAYPDQIARNILLPILLVFTLQNSERSSKQNLFLVCALAALITFTHLFSFLAYALIIGFLLLIYLTQKNWLVIKRMGLVFGLSILLSIALLAVKIASIASFVVNSDVISILRTDGFWVSKKLFIILPIDHFDLFRWVIFSLGLLIIICLFIFRSSNFNRQKIFLILVMSLTPFIVLLIPYFATFGSKIFTYTYIHRLWFIVPFYLLAAVIIDFILKGIAKIKTRPSRTYLIKIASVTAIFIILLSPFAVPKYYANVKNKIAKQENTENYFNGDPIVTDQLIKYIREKIPNKSVFFSDGWTSYRIGARTNNYVVTSLRQHFSPVLPRDERIDEIEYDLYSRNLEQIINSLDTLRVDYWVVNKPYSEYKAYYNLSEKLDFYPQLFEKIYSNQNYTIYKVDIGQENLNVVMDSLYKDALLNISNPETALTKISQLLIIKSDDVEALTLFEKIRQENKFIFDEEKNLIRFGTGSQIMDSSVFNPPPNGIDALFDGGVLGPTDYLAGINDTLPNWFTINFQIPRKITSYSITWFSQKESGANWTFYGLTDSGWTEIDKLVNQPAAASYTHFFKEAVVVKSVKLEVYTTNNQPRALIKKMDVR